MAEDKLLEQIRKVVREENEPIKNRLDAQGSSIAQIKTIVETTAAGQKEIQETMATKADVFVFIRCFCWIMVVLCIEEHTGSSTHKN